MSNELPVLEDAPQAITFEEAFGAERGPDISLMDWAKNKPKISRFFRLAARGGPGGSGGEQRCRNLAKLMSKAIEESANTDLDAVEGAALLMVYASTGGDGYCFVRDLLNKNGYKG